MQRKLFDELSFANEEIEYLDDLIEGIENQLLNADEESGISLPRFYSLDWKYTLDDMTYFYEDFRSRLYRLEETFAQFQYQESLKLQCEKLRKEFREKHQEWIQAMDRKFDSFMNASGYKDYIRSVLTIANTSIKNSQNHTNIADVRDSILKINDNIKSFWDRFPRSKDLDKYPEELKDYRIALTYKLLFQFTPANIKFICLDLLEHTGKKNESKKVQIDLTGFFPRQLTKFDIPVKPASRVYEFIKTHADFFSAPFRECQFQFQNWCEENKNPLIFVLSAGLKIFMQTSDEKKMYSDSVLEIYQNKNTKILEQFLWNDSNMDLINFMEVLIKRHSLESVCNEWKRHQEEAKFITNRFSSCSLRGVF